MRVVHKRCAGLDVHQKSITACVRVALKRKVVRETRVFGTGTSELLEMADWLGQSGCTIVATGVYWKPVWHVLEGHFELVLAQPAHVGASAIKCCYAAAGSGTGAEETGLRALVSRKTSIRGGVVARPGANR